MFFFWSALSRTEELFSLIYSARCCARDCLSTAGLSSGVHESLKHSIAFKKTASFVENHRHPYRTGVHDCHGLGVSATHSNLCNPKTLIALNPASQDRSRRCVWHSDHFPRLFRTPSGDPMQVSENTSSHPCAAFLEYRVIRSQDSRPRLPQLLALPLFGVPEGSRRCPI